MTKQKSLQILPSFSRQDFCAVIKHEWSIIVRPDELQPAKQGAVILTDKLAIKYMKIHSSYYIPSFVREQQIMMDLWAKAKERGISMQRMLGVEIPKVIHASKAHAIFAMNRVKGHEILHTTKAQEKWVGKSFAKFFFEIDRILTEKEDAPRNDFHFMNRSLAPFPPGLSYLTPHLERAILLKQSPCPTALRNMYHDIHSGNVLVHPKQKKIFVLDFGDIIKMDPHLVMAKLMVVMGINPTLHIIENLNNFARLTEKNKDRQLWIDKNRALDLWPLAVACTYSTYDRPQPCEEKIIHIVQSELETWKHQTRKLDRKTTHRPLLYRCGAKQSLLCY